MSERGAVAFLFIRVEARPNVPLLIASGVVT